MGRTLATKVPFCGTQAPQVTDAGFVPQNSGLPSNLPALIGKRSAFESLQETELELGG